VSRPGLAASAALVALALNALPGTALADTIVLKNGRRIEGHVMIANDREVTVRTPGGIIMRFERRQVSSIEKEDDLPPSGVESPKPPADDGIIAPDGASDGEVERLRALIPQLRDTSRRWLEARKDREEAEKASATDAAARAGTREKEFARTLDGLKKAREAIDRSAAARYVETQRAAEKEGERLRVETEALRTAQDGAGLEDRATKLRARAPESPRDPYRKMILGEAVHAMAAAGEVAAQRARDSTTDEGRAVGLIHAAERFTWCAGCAEGESRALAFKQAIQSYVEAHRSLGFRPVEIEHALIGIHAFKACASLVDERNTERRWGAELSENEGGQFRLELTDGRVVYGDEVPTTSFARSARERRERTEQRSTKEGGTTRTQLVKVTRWYELFWDPVRKRWSRESQLTQLEGSKLIPLLNSAQELEDQVAKERAGEELAARTVAERRDGVQAARRSCDQGDAGEDAVEKAAKDLAAARAELAARDDAVSKAQGAVEAKLRELAELDRDLEKAKKGE
jgi:hypothetical protein